MDKRREGLPAMGKKRIWLALLVVLSLVLSGCGAGEVAAPQGSDQAASGGAPTSARAPAADAGVRALTIRDTAEAAVDEASAAVTDRKIVRNAEVELHVRDVDEAQRAIEAALARVGGYVQESEMSGTREYGRNVTMRLRVPAGQFGSLLELIRGLGEVRSLRQWTDDVTEQYVDLEARIATAEAHLAQLNKLYERSGTISEMLELEREIARVTAELESLKGRFSVLANQVAFSTVSVNLYEPGAPEPSRNPQTLGERMRDSFLFSWNATLELAEGLLVAVAGMIPGLLFLTVLGGILALLIWLAARRRGARRSPPTGGGPGPAATAANAPTAPAEGGGEPAGGREDAGGPGAEAP